MKTKLKFITLLLILIICTWIRPQKTAAQGVSVSYQVFYDDLSPYGTWVDIPNYGYVWSPDVYPGFTPYATNGYWVLTNAGWTWVSDYPWGWAPFHYGRWYTDDTYGPIWIPGNEWGPGWVSWRKSNDYYGWAPMEPGVSIGMAYGNDYYPEHNHWTIMHGRDFGRRDISNYYVNSKNNTMIINNSTVINNAYYDKAHNASYKSGPDRADVEKHIGTKINPVTIKESNKPGQSLGNNQLKMYKPQVQKNNANGSRPAPSKVASYNDVKTLAQRTSETPSKKSYQPTKEQPKQNAWQSPKQVQPQQQNNQNKTSEEVKQQQQVSPSKKEEGAKQQQVAPPKKEEGVKQQQSVPTKRVGEANQQQNAPHKNTNESEHPHK
ncbi:MAG: DUF6600 domain-containing protein [Bacteroidales bacterium]|jgi:hypothetical protein